MRAPLRSHGPPITRKDKGLGWTNFVECEIVLRKLFAFGRRIFTSLGKPQWTFLPPTYDSF